MNPPDSQYAIFISIANVSEGSNLVELSNLTSTHAVIAPTFRDSMSCLGQ